jgi:hypothetical protein
MLCRVGRGGGLGSENVADHFYGASPSRANALGARRPSGSGSRPEGAARATSSDAVTGGFAVGKRAAAATLL